MDVAIHLGAHCTDAERVQKTLWRNREVLADLGVVVPRADSYREILREVMNTQRGAPADATQRDVVAQATGTDATTLRLVLSNPNFISMISKVVDDGQIYPRIAKAQWLRNVFPDEPVAFFLAVRNPATLLPALFDRMDVRYGDFPDFLARVEPLILRWSDTVAALRDACPDCPVTVWCHEDTPVFWSEVIHSVAGVTDRVPLKGSFDMLRPVMTHEGMNRLRAYTKNTPPKSEAAKRRVMAAFLDKFALPEAVEETRVLPGWSADLVQRLSTIYERDIAAIDALPGVRVLAK